ncbi:penicillin-binding protein [Candidatus Woesebacteria bacterium]|nr:penicillin-binding protein [Candidatus Woesebacteria bacterium]
MEINLSKLKRQTLGFLANLNPFKGRKLFLRDKMHSSFSGSRSRLNKASKSRFSQQSRQLFYAKLFRITAIGSLILIVGGIVVFFLAFAWFSRNLPKPGEVVRRDGYSTKIYDRNDKLLYDLFDDEQRTPVSIDQIPKDLQNATVAIEDKDFYKHSGFDMLTIIRIPYNAIFKGRVVGGSTLTQQLVKNALLTNERSVVRKFKELVLSLQIERKFTKAEILEMYLNEAPYGGTAWGVGSASEIYFNKPINELNLVESAVLAGLPQRPSAYSPYAGKTDEDGQPLWKLRAKGVLRRMQEDGYITDLAYEQAMGDLDTIVFEKSAISIKAPHFVFYVSDLLADLVGEDAVEAGGFKVTTSLDLDMQEKAEQVVFDEVNKVEKLNITNGAALVMNPKTGEILSMVGSKDYSNSEIGGQFNVVVDGLRQPGSAIKPITYLAMIQNGYSPSTMLADVPTVFSPHENAKAYEPKNYDGKFRGPVSLRNSLGSSLNIPAVKSLAIVGVQNFLSLAFDMGLETLEPTKENMQKFGLAATLGGADVHMLDLTTAYSSFANYGEKVEPVAILKIEDKDGNVVYDYRHLEGRRVFLPQEAFLINNILSDNFARAIAFGTSSLLNISPNVAVKTGTTNDQRDNWAIGWSQEVIVAAWVGNNDNSEMKSVASGVSGATPIWRNIMVAALDSDSYAAPDWIVPSGIEKIAVDKISGWPIHDDFESREDYFISESIPTLPDPIHQKIKLCKGEMKLATDARIAANDYEEKEFIVLKEADPFSTDGVNRWQMGIDAWVNAQEDGRYKVPTELCGDVNEIYVTLSEPEDHKNFTDDKIKVKVNSDSRDGISKLEIYVDGVLRETINNERKYEGTITLSAGKHEIKAKAYSRSGETKESNAVKIGTGGVAWDQADPTPTPSPTSTPTPTATPTVIPLTCNASCTTDIECTSSNPLWTCYAPANKCRLLTNPISPSCESL